MFVFRQVRKDCFRLQRWRYSFTSATFVSTHINPITLLNENTPEKSLSRRFVVLQISFYLHGLSAACGRPLEPVCLRLQGPAAVRFPRSFRGSVHFRDGTRDEICCVFCQLGMCPVTRSCRKGEKGELTGVLGDLRTQP